MKKFLVLILSLVLAVTMFTACGGSSDEPQGETGSDTETAGDFDPAAVTTFGDVFSVIDSETVQEAYSEKVYVYAFPVGEDYYRAETELSEEDSAALWAVDFEDPDRDAKIKEIVSPLEITSLTNLNENAPDQAYIDSLIGKTGQELFDEGWSYNYYNLEDMEAGLDHEYYSFTVTFDYDGEQMENTDDFDFYEEFKDLTVKTATYDGIGDATYIADVQG